MIGDQSTKDFLKQTAAVLLKAAEQLDHLPDPEMLDLVGNATPRDLHKRVFALCGELGVTDREVMLEMINELLRGQQQDPLITRAGMTVRQMRRIVQGLEDYKIVDSYTPGIH